MDQKSAMKNIILFTSAFLGSSIFASDAHHSLILTRGADKRVSHKSSAPVGTVSILIDKSDYELNVYDDKGWYATYPVVFGNNSLDDKKMEGDRNTPEGTFQVTGKRVHNKWYRFIAIDYPNKESREKFNKRKERGELPANARIGGSIGIHGTWPHEDFQVDRFRNWTLGCISMKRNDVLEIYDFVTAGTQVMIRK